MSLATLLAIASMSRMLALHCLVVSSAWLTHWKQGHSEITVSKGMASSLASRAMADWLVMAMHCLAGDNMIGCAML